MLQEKEKLKLMWQYVELKRILFQYTSLQNTSINHPVCYFSSGHIFLLPNKVKYLKKEEKDILKNFFDENFKQL